MNGGWTSRRLSSPYLDKGPPALFPPRRRAPFRSAFLAIARVDETGEGQKPDRQADHHARNNGCHANYPTWRLFAIPNNGMIDAIGVESSGQRSV